MRGSLAAGIVATALAAIAPSGARADIVWTLGDCGGAPWEGTANGEARVCSPSGSPINLTGTAWSDTGDVSGMDQIQNAMLPSYPGGWGVINREESRSMTDHPLDNAADEDADDNSDVVGDSIFFVFDAPISLTGVIAGHVHNDGDVSVLAFTGAGAPVLGGRRYAELLGPGGWAVIGSYDLSEYLLQPISTAVASRYWMIAAYNPIFGTGPDLGVGTGYRTVEVWDPNINCREVGFYPNRVRICDGGWRTVTQSYDDRDYLKVSSVSGKEPETPNPPGGDPLPPAGDPNPPSQVPEPGTLALLGAALSGVALTSRARLDAALERRRRKSVGAPA